MSNTAELRAVVDTALEKGFNPATLISSLQMGSGTAPSSLVQQIATTAGMPAPALVYDQGLLRQLWNTTTSSNGYKMTPEWVAYLDKVQAAGMKPFQITSALSNAMWSGVSAFTSAAPSAGTPPALTT